MRPVRGLLTKTPNLGKYEQSSLIDVRRDVQVSFAIIYQSNKLYYLKSVR